MLRLIASAVLAMIALMFTGALLVLVFALTARPAYAAEGLTETRYCGDPARDKSGKIARRAVVTAAFKRIHPCPATGKPTGACPGWAIDHVVPLAVGGCDAVPNLQWLPTSIKSCQRPECKDRFERRVYRVTP
jgi:hypothetical protein